MNKKIIFLFGLLTYFLPQIGIAIAPLNQVKQTVKLATTDWPPYVGQKLPGFGYVYAVVTEAMQRSGYDVSVQFMSWPEAIQLNKYHNDGYFPEYKTNNASVACTDPIFGGPVALYKRTDSVIRYGVDNPGKNQEVAFQSLKNFRIGVVEGYTNTDAFDKAIYLKKASADNDYDNLKNLADGKVDLAFTDVFVAEYLKDQHPEIENIEMMGPSLQNEMLFVCFSKKTPDYMQKVAAFNAGLKQLKDTGEIQALMQKYNY